MVETSGVWPQGLLDACIAMIPKADGEVLLFSICRFVAAVTAGSGHWVASAAARTQTALDGFLALVGVLALESRFSVVEGMNRHVLAGSLFSGTWGTGVRTSGRNRQGHSAASRSCKRNSFPVSFFVKSLGGASYVVKMEHQATVARVKQHVALRSGVCEDAFLPGQGRQGASGGRHVGMSRRWCGTRNCTCVPISVAVRVWADSPRFLGNGYASLVAWVGAGRRGKVVTGAVHLGWAGMVARGLKESLTTLDSQATRGCPSILRKGIEGLQRRQWSVSSECGAHWACACI